MDYIDFNNDHAPLGYLITFRSYGTWLHGDARGSVDRFHNAFGTPRLPYNERWQKHNRNVLKQGASETETASKSSNKRGDSRDVQDSQVGILDDECTHQSRSHRCVSFL